MAAGINLAKVVSMTLKITDTPIHFEISYPKSEVTIIARYSYEKEVLDVTPDLYLKKEKGTLREFEPTAKEVEVIGLDIANELFRRIDLVAKKQEETAKEKVNVGQNTTEH